MLENETAYKRGLFANHRFWGLKKRVLGFYKGQNPFVRFYSWFRWGVSPYFEMARIIPPESNIVDMGCGFGLLGACMAALHPKLRYTGLDVDDRRIGVANESIRVEGVSFHTADWYAFPISNVDVFTFVDVLHHLPEEEQGRILHYCKERLSEEGIVLVKDVGTHPKWKYLANLIFDATTMRLSVTLGDKPYYRSITEWTKLGSSLGFEVEEIPLLHKDYAPHILLKLRPT